MIYVRIRVEKNVIYGWKHLGACSAGGLLVVEFTLACCQPNGVIKRFYTPLTATLYPVLGHLQFLVIYLIVGLTNILSVTHWLMTDTAHLMQSVKGSNCIPFIVDFVLSFILPVKSVGDNETDVTIPGYFITQSRDKIVDFTIPFFSQGFFFWIKSSSVSMSFK